MKQVLPILAVVAGLGSFISCKPAQPPAKPLEQAQKPASSLGSAAFEVDPLQVYLESEKMHRHEKALVEFAADCGLDLEGATVRYAERSDVGPWDVAPDVTKISGASATDFYGTVGVWHKADRIVVEQWRASNEMFSVERSFYCFHGSALSQVDVMNWTDSGYEGDDTSGESQGGPDWGYEHRWKRGSDGTLLTTLRRYVDVHGEPMAAPKLNAETLKGLDRVTAGASTWADLKLPVKLLQ